MVRLRGGASTREVWRDEMCDDVTCEGGVCEVDEKVVVYFG